MADPEKPLHRRLSDRQAHRALVEQLLDRVRTTVAYLAAGDPDTDDLVQASMVEILRSLKTYEGRGSLESWADRITVRTSLRLLKERSRRGEVSLSDSGQADSTGAPTHYLALVTDQEEQSRSERFSQRMAQLLHKLTPKHRVAVVLRWVHGYSLKEIAEITDTPVNTVRDRLQKGKRRLRKLILRDRVLAELSEE